MARLLALAAAAACAFAAPPPPNLANITFLTEEAAKLGAVCLDGSPAAFYFRQEAETTKFYIHQQGGGWCESDNDCYGRSNTRLGSSTGYAAVQNLGDGYFSNDPNLNPFLYNFSKIFLPYCDGGSQTGDLEDAVNVPGAKHPIYYRGHRILRAMIAHLLASPTVGLSAATDVVVSGCSAGGLATYLHADEWLAALPKSSKVVAMPDSGFFLDYNNTAGGGYGAALRWVFQRFNSTGGVPAACVEANPQDPARCIFAEHVSPTLRTPFFALQSEYDSWQVANILDQPTSNNASINAYGNTLTSRLQQDLLRTPANPGHGAFLDSCYHHCGQWGSLVVDGMDQSAAFQAWYNSLDRSGSRKLWAQNQGYPCAACCHGGNVSSSDGAGCTHAA